MDSNAQAAIGWLPIGTILTGSGLLSEEQLAHASKRRSTGAAGSVTCSSSSATCPRSRSHGFRLVREGICSLEEIRRVTGDRLA